MTAMSNTCKAERMRRLELMLWMEERDITITATAQQLGWPYSTTRYNLMDSSEPERRAAILALGFPEKLLPPLARRRGRPSPRFPGLEQAAPDMPVDVPGMVSS